MLQSKTLVELAEEIVSRQQTKIDIVAPTKKLSVYATGGGAACLEVEETAYGINRHAHSQIASRLKVPMKFYDRVLENHPDLWSQTVNTLFERESEDRMIRILDGNVRAFLSDSYRRIDHEDIADVILPLLLKVPDLQISRCNVTDSKMYIDAVVPSREAEVKVGDKVQAGISISNSEIGSGSFIIQPYVWRLTCLNGQKFKEFGLNKYHVGGRAGSDEEIVQIFYSDETKKLDDQALISKTKDIVNGMIEGDVFDNIVYRLQKATLDTMPDVERSVEYLATNYQLNESERKGVLFNIIKEGNLNRYGLANGVSYVAHEQSDYDRAMELETLSGKIIDLPETDWHRIAA